MTILYSDKLLGLWYAEIPPGNMFTALETTDTGFRVVTRLRIYKDDKVFDSEDEKTWYEVLCDTKSYDEMVDNIRKMMSGAPGVGRIYEALREDKTVNEFFEEWTSLPFIHKEVHKTH